MIFSRDIGIDLGTANTVICDKKGRIIIREPSVVAVDVKTKRVLATGDEAKTMIGRTPGSIIAVRPLQDGVIADFDMTSDMLRSFIYRSSRRNLFTRTRVVVSVPSGVTEVERRAVEDAVRSAGAQDVELIEESMAAAIGAGLPVFEATGYLICDLTFSHRMYDMRIGKFSAVHPSAWRRSPSSFRKSGVRLPQHVGHLCHAFRQTVPSRHARRQ